MAKRRFAKSDKKPYAERIAERFIEQLKAGTAPWTKPWTPGMHMLPHNPVTGTIYKGINNLVLQSAGFSDPRWVTFKQVVDNEWSVKGQKSETIQFWKFSERVAIKDGAGKVVDHTEEKLKRPRVFYANVFNGEQVQGMPAYEPPPITWDPLEKAERYVEAMEDVGARIYHDQPDLACYMPQADTIHMPSKSQFASAGLYYSVLLHELGHWSGHSSRLGRDKAGGFGSPSYALEELRVEIFSHMQCAELGIEHDPSRHASYIASWIKALENDHMEIFRAAADAEKIRAYMADIVKDYDQSLSEDINSLAELEVDSLPQPHEIHSPSISPIH